MLKTITVLGCLGLLTGCVGTTQTLPSNYQEVTENRVDGFKAPNGAGYDMRTYIVPFQNPYYITVKPSPDLGVSFKNGPKIAYSAAAAYIKPRGCTAPIKHLPQFDRFNEDRNEWLIGISC